MSRKENVLNAFLSGEELTAKQIAARFNVANPTALVSDLRMSGYPVYLNNGTKDARGRVRSAKYRLGSASRAVIAAGYKALASA
jgi:predicted DNA-binding transcriptional regulator YafY